MEDNGAHPGQRGTHGSPCGCVLAHRGVNYTVAAEFAVPADSPLRAGQPATLVLP